jgi:hypothetical protein
LEGQPRVRDRQEPEDPRQPCTHHVTFGKNITDTTNGDTIKNLVEYIRSQYVRHDP